MARLAEEKGPEVATNASDSVIGEVLESCDRSAIAHAQRPLHLSAGVRDQATPLLPTADAPAAFIRVAREYLRDDVERIVLSRCRHLIVSLLRGGCAGAAGVGTRASTRHPPPQPFGEYGSEASGLPSKKWCDPASDH